MQISWTAYNYKQAGLCSADRGEYLDGVTASPTRAGRPRRSSRETIEDAAVELFLEQGYPRTSVDQIAQRAGVSRASFFNYFAAKSDVLWVGVDDSTHRLAEELARPAAGDPVANEPSVAAAPSVPSAPSSSSKGAAEAVAVSASAVETAVSALLTVAGEFGPERAPWAVTEAEAMGIGDELGASALPRFAALSAALAEHLRARGGFDPSLARSTAAALTAAVASAAVDWARAGSRRGSLAPWVDAALRPLTTGLAASAPE